MYVRTYEYSCDMHINILIVVFDVFFVFSVICVYVHMYVLWNVYQDIDCCEGPLMKSVLSD